MRVARVPTDKEIQLIIDVHTHLFPKRIRDSRDRYFADEPAFELLYGDPKARMIGVKTLVETMDAHGVDISVICGFPWLNETTCRHHNDYILEAVARYPDRFIGLCCVNPFDPAAEGEVGRCLELGLSGVGEVAFYQPGGITAGAVKLLEPIMRLCREKGLPVLIHTNEPVGHAYPGKTDNTLIQIYEMVKTYPENKIILGHWGGGLFFYNLLKKEVRQALANVWFDTAASPYLYEPDIYRVSMALAGEEKILFGTDYPLIAPSRYYKEIAASGISDAAREKLLGGNCAALFGISRQ